MDYTNDLNQNIEIEKDLYSILQINNDAEQPEIKNAYKKLALKYHPDKSSSDNTYYFQEITNAYEILSDKKKKDIYDNYGLLGIDLYQHLDNEYISDIIFNKFILCKIYTIISTIFSLIFTQLILITLKIDNKWDTNWYLILLPSWFLNTIIITIFNYISIVLISENSFEKNYITNYIYGNIILLLIIIQEILIGYKLEYNNILLYKILIPLYFIEFIYIINCGYELLYNDIENYQLRYLNNLNYLIYNILKIAFYVFFIIKLDFPINLSWTFIFLPLYILLISHNIFCYLYDLKKLEIIIDSDDYIYKKNLYLTKNFLITFFSLVFLIILILININLNYEYLIINTTIIFIPILIFLSIFICCCCCCLPIASLSDNSKKLYYKKNNLLITNI